MNASVYIETTIPSLLTARPSRDLIIAARQEITRLWWETRKDKYSLFISDFVIEEVSRGDSNAASSRLKVLEDLSLIEIDDEVISLTETILKSGLIPIKAAMDAGHIAVASRHSIDYMITWNCNHLANAEILRYINFIVSEAGYFLPTICTPDELFGGEINV